jgi:hypothetical protein
MLCSSCPVFAPRFQGLREGALYEQLSNRYLKLLANMRKRSSSSVKAERDQVSTRFRNRPPLPPLSHSLSLSPWFFLAPPCLNPPIPPSRALSRFFSLGLARPPLPPPLTHTHTQRCHAHRQTEHTHSTHGIDTQSASAGGSSCSLQALFRR